MRSDKELRKKKSAHSGMGQIAPVKSGVWREDGVTPSLEDVVFTLASASECHCRKLNLNTGDGRRDHACTWSLDLLTLCPGRPTSIHSLHFQLCLKEDNALIDSRRGRQ